MVMHHHAQNIKPRSAFVDSNKAFDHIEIYEQDRIEVATCVWVKW